MLAIEKATSQEIFAAILRGDSTEAGEANSTFTNAGQKLAHHPQVVETLLKGGVPIPVSMEVDLSYFCGDSCNFCHFAYTHENPPRKNLLLPQREEVFLSPVRAERNFRELARGGVKSIVFSGGGEPLDNPHALDIFELAKVAGLEMGMYTRGYGLRGQVADFVAEHFAWLVVSLDVTNFEDHKRVKGTGEKIFHTKVENIRQFVAREQRKANISISLMVGSEHLQPVPPYDEQKTLLGDGINTITKMERDTLWMLGLGVDEVQVRPIVDTGSYAEQRRTKKVGNLAFKTDDEAWKNHYFWIPPMRQLLHLYKAVPGLNTSDDKFVDLYEGVSGYGQCDGMVVSAGVVDTMGVMYKCVNLRKITPIGDLNKQSLAEIYATVDRRVDTLCRAGCRGCKVNQAMYQLRNGSSLPPQDPTVKHVNFI